MPYTAKMKELHRRQRRVTTLRKLKAKLLSTQDSRVRERIMAKIRKLAPFQTLPKR